MGDFRPAPSWGGLSDPGSGVMAINCVQVVLTCDGIGPDGTGCDAFLETDLGSADGGMTWHTDHLQGDVEREGWLWVDRERQLCPECQKAYRDDPEGYRYWD